MYKAHHKVNSPERWEKGEMFFWDTTSKWHKWAFYSFFRVLYQNCQNATFSACKKATATGLEVIEDILLFILNTKWPLRDILLLRYLVNNQLDCSPAPSCQLAKQISNPTWCCNVYHWVCKFIVVLIFFLGSL